jgi:hypothetical protein
MIYAEYINQIGFKFLQPHVPVKTFLETNRWASRIVASEKLTHQLEAMNTEVPAANENIEKLRTLLDVPRMSSFAISIIINKGVSLMRSDLAFVNVGVWNGFTLLSGMTNNTGKKCVGIDNFSEFGGPRESFLERFNHYKSPSHCFYEMDFAEYFRTVHRGMIGAYLYDGDHSYECQLKGLELAEPFFADDCLVFVDDTNWAEPRSATLEFISRSTNSYDILLDKVTCQNRHPTFWNGFMVLRCRRVPSDQQT